MSEARPQQWCPQCQKELETQTAQAHGRPIPFWMEKGEVWMGEAVKREGTKGDGGKETSCYIK